jgi:hypothetical protein
MNTPRLGVCYYPEHWAAPMWADDARRMRDLGVSGVVQKWPVLGNTDNKNPAARQGWF